MSIELNHIDEIRNRAEKENDVINSFILQCSLYTAQEIAIQLSPASDEQLKKITRILTSGYREDLIPYETLIIDIVRDFLEDLKRIPPEIIGKISRLYCGGHVFKGPNGGDMSDELLGSKVINNLSKMSERGKATSIARGLLTYGRNRKIIN